MSDQPARPGRPRDPPRLVGTAAAGGWGRRDRRRTRYRTGLLVAGGPSRTAARLVRAQCPSSLAQPGVLPSVLLVGARYARTWQELLTDEPRSTDGPDGEYVEIPSSSVGFASTVGGNLTDRGRGMLPIRPPADTAAVAGVVPDWAAQYRYHGCNTAGQPSNQQSVPSSNRTTPCIRPTSARRRWHSVSRSTTSRGMS